MTSDDFGFIITRHVNSEINIGMNVSNALKDAIL